MPSAENPNSLSLRDELSLRERQIDAIRRIAGELFAYGNVDDMLCKTLTVAVDVLGADVGSLQLYDAETGCLSFRCVLDPAEARLVGTSYPVAQGIGGQVFRTGKGQITRHAREQQNFNPAIDRLTGYHTDSMLTVPLRCHNKPCLGVMQVLNAPRAFDESDLAVLEALGAQIASAIEAVRMAEDAKRAELVSIIGEIAHDIKNLLTPLNAGVATLQVIIEKALESIDEICRQCPSHQPWGNELNASVETLRTNYEWVLKSTLSASERVNTSTREIADAVKGELSPPRFEMGDLNEVVREVVEVLQHLAQSSYLHLQTDLDSELPQSLFDHRQLFNALYNLVNNAIPETPEGGTITVRTRTEGETIVIAVCDTGRGIPDEIREKLFSDGAISTKIHGSGLGTHITASIVRRHGGQITVESADDKGATFTIRLPVRHNALPYQAIPTA